MTLSETFLLLLFPFFLSQLLFFLSPPLSLSLSLSPLSRIVSKPRCPILRASRFWPRRANLFNGAKEIGAELSQFLRQQVEIDLSSRVKQSSKPGVQVSFSTCSQCCWPPLQISKFSRIALNKRQVSLKVDTICTNLIICTSNCSIARYFVIIFINQSRWFLYSMLHCAIKKHFLDSEFQLHPRRTSTSFKRNKKRKKNVFIIPYPKKGCSTILFFRTSRRFVHPRPVFAVVEAKSKGGHPPGRFVWREYVSLVYSSRYFRGDTSIRYSAKFPSATSQQSRGPRKKGWMLSAPPFPSFFPLPLRGIDVGSVNENRRKIVNRPTRYFYLWILREL